MTIFLLVLSVILGGLVPFFLKSSEKAISNFLAFSASYLLCVTFFHLFPELFEFAHHNESSRVYVGLFLFVGFLFQKTLEFFSGGVEHGHIQKHNTVNPYILLIALFIHALLEGMVLIEGSSHQQVHSGLHGHHHSDHILYGVVLHKIPAAFALGSILLFENIRKITILLLLIIFSLASPIGVLLGEVSLHHLSPEYTVFLFAFVTGNLLHIATTVFNESSNEQKLSVVRWGLVLFGAGIAMIVEFL